MVAVAAEASGHYAFQKLAERMAADPEGLQILEERPIINTTTVDFEKLLELPINTFGYQYAFFMAQNVSKPPSHSIIQHAYLFYFHPQKISADTRKSVKFIDSEELAYVCQRYRETHDLVHALLGMKTNMLGEVTVKWVEALQTNLPMCWSAAIVGPARLYPKQRSLYVKTYLPWALKCGHQAKLFMNVYFEKRFEQDADDLRSELNIPGLKREIVNVSERRSQRTV